MKVKKDKKEGNTDKREEIEEDNTESPTLESPKKLWVEILSGNHNLVNEMTIEFLTPKIFNGEIEIKIKESDMKNEAKFWDTTLIMYILGGELSMNDVKQFMTNMWNFMKFSGMFYNEEGYFIICFHSYFDMYALLMKGAYTIRNMSMLLREWKPDFNLKNDMLRTLPI